MRLKHIEQTTKLTQNNLKFFLFYRITDIVNNIIRYGCSGGFSILFRGLLKINL